MKTISRTLGSRETRFAIASDGPTSYERKPAGSAADEVKDAIHAQAVLVLTMLAMVMNGSVDAWDHGVEPQVTEPRPGLSSR